MKKIQDLHPPAQRRRWRWCFPPVVQEAGLQADELTKSVIRDSSPFWSFGLTWAACTVIPRFPFMAGSHALFAKAHTPALQRGAVGSAHVPSSLQTLCPAPAPPVTWAHTTTPAARPAQLPSQTQTPEGNSAVLRETELTCKRRKVCIWESAFPRPLDLGSNSS